MSKRHLIDDMAERAGITKAQATAALEQFILTLCEAVREGSKVTIVGFGTFSVATRSPRSGRNPRDNQPIQIAAKRVVRFKPGKQLLEALNGAKPKKKA